MPAPFGIQAKSTVLTGPESHKLALEFQAAPHVGKIILSADLVADDSFVCTVQGVAITPTAYAVGHAQTMAAILVKLNAHTAIESAKLSPADIDNRTIVFVLKDETAIPVITLAAVTNTGDGTAVATTSLTYNYIYAGMPVGLIGMGEMVAGIAVIADWYGTLTQKYFIGVSMHYAAAGALCTVFVKGYVVTYGKASGAVVAGPVKMVGISTADEVLTAGYEFGYCTFANTSTVTEIVGWSLSNVADTEIIKVLMGY